MLTVAKEEKMLHQYQDPYRFEAPLNKKLVDLISRPTKPEKKSRLQKTYIFRKRAQKLKNIWT